MGKKNTFLSVIVFLFFTVVAILILIPFLAILIASFKDGTDMIRNGLNLKIELDKMSLDNFKLLFSGAEEARKYFMWYKNSLILTLSQVALTLVVSAFVGYGFAAYDFKGKNALFICVLIIMSVPFEILMLPLYTQVGDMGISDTYAAIMMPFLAHASTIFFFKQYLAGIPGEIIEAGRIDGASEYGIFARLILPVMKPSFAAMAILNAMNSWNNFLWPLLVLRTDTKYTLPIGLNTLLTPYGNNYDLLIVGSFCAILPIFILFLLFQKYFIEGMTAGAVKG